MRKTIIVFCDGLGYYQLPHEFVTEDLKWVIPLQNQDPTITAPNWASLLSGQPPSVHGILENGKEVASFRGTTFMNDAGSDTKVISDWVRFRHLTPGTTFLHNRTPLRALYESQAAVTLINVDRLDSRAHKFGWQSIQAQRTRVNIAKELEVFMDHQGTEPYVLYVLADHGGFGTEHDGFKKGSEEESQVRTVPFLCYSNQEVSPEEPQIDSTLQVREWFRSQW